jgi:hypothetical protein
VGDSPRRCAPPPRTLDSLEGVLYQVPLGTPDRRGILVPPIRFNGDDVVEWFDVNAALLTALMIVGTTAVPLRSGEDGFAEDRGIIRLPSQRPGIDGVPAVKSDQLATGQVLRNAGFSPVSLLRHARQRLHPRHS